MYTNSPSRRKQQANEQANAHGPIRKPIDRFIGEIPQRLEKIRDHKPLVIEGYSAACTQ
ncbi:MAG: hypothetical protein LW719_10560 [Comamonadaceae bacterium]|nr:hypothetical protein [Comamonadaceae bacterium]